MAAYDIVVAGGGPAGLQFAREIGYRTDHSVAVVEANQRLADNDKSTGGPFYQAVDGFDIPDHVVMDSSRRVTFEGPTAREQLPIPNYVLDFPAFLEYLGEDAASQGVDVHTGVRVTAPIVEGDRVVGITGRTDGREVAYRADVVVDATGPAGVLTTQLGMWDREAAQRGIGKEFEVEGRFDCDSMLFRFDHQYAPGGYAWTFPAGDDVFKIGVCWVDDFYARHSRPDDGTIDAYVWNWVESDSRWSVERVRAVHAGEVLSDNSMNQRVGEGIRPGLESAAMAADVVADALAAGDTSRESLAAYERRWNRERGTKWKTQRMVGELLYDFTAEQQDRFVTTAGQLAERQTERLQRDELTLLDLLDLYPFALGGLSKLPTLLRHAFSRRGWRSRL